MFTQMRYPVDREPDSASKWPHGRRAGDRAMSRRRPPSPITDPGVWDRERDGWSLAKGGRCRPVLADLLAFVGRVGLALFLTAGFAIALDLYTGLTMGSPSMVRACAGVFLWTLVLVSSSWPGRA
jgi:hypothetical protein